MLINWWRVSFVATADTMNNESTCHQPSTLTVDSLSYKELQGLAMSLSLPGKMKVSNESQLCCVNELFIERLMNLFTNSKGF